MGERKVDFTYSALDDLDNILETTLNAFGTLQLERYTVQIQNAIQELEEAGSRAPLLKSRPDIRPGGKGRCLSVNGTAFDQTPGTLSVRYVRQGNQLKASEIHYQYWESKKEFPAEAKCPEDFELTFPAS